MCRKLGGSAAAEAEAPVLAAPVLASVPATIAAAATTIARFHPTSQA
jgi:hypothetical protein